MAAALRVKRPALAAIIVIDVESLILEMSNTDAMIAYGLPASSLLQYMKIAVPVRKSEHSRTIAKSSKKRCLNTATTTATTVVKEKDVSDGTEPAESLNLSPKAVTALEALLQAMRTVCYVYTEEFCNLHDTHNLQGGEDLGEDVNLILCDRSYNVRRQRKLLKSKHNAFKEKNMDALCNFANYVLKRKRHEHIFF